MTLEKLQQLAGQTVVVIGGSSGIGLETARRARAEGADVILTARDPDRLHRGGGNCALAAELGYEVTMVKDATADYSDGEMHAALDVNIPSYASAIVTTNEVVDSISSL
jgi:NAD(P)-dependent dehydrogenase (short-subunit alcohol dehydrogenase family)